MKFLHLSIVCPEAQSKCGDTYFDDRTDIMKDGDVITGQTTMFPHWLKPHHFLSHFLCQASWFCPVWTKLEAITSDSREITSPCYTLWLIFHNTASPF